jgi:hypothetical protein
VQQGRQLVDGSEHRPAGRLLRDGADEAVDDEAQGPAILELAGEGQGGRAGPDHDDATLVPAPATGGTQHQPEPGAEQDGRDRLKRQEDQDHEPADIDQVEEEQGRERDESKDGGGPNDRHRFALRGPVRPGPIRAVEAQQADPRDGIRRQEDRGRANGCLPIGLPAGAEADHRDEHEEAHRDDRVDAHHQRPKKPAVAPNHCVASRDSSRANPARSSRSRERITVSPA